MQGRDPIQPSPTGQPGPEATFAPRQAQPNAAVLRQLLSLGDEQLVALLQRYLTILQGHPTAEAMVEQVLTDDFETGFIGGHVWSGIDGLRDFLSQREGFFDEKHTIDELLDRGEADEDVQARTRLHTCFHTWRVRQVDGEWRLAAQMGRTLRDPGEGLNR